MPNRNVPDEIFSGIIQANQAVVSAGGTQPNNGPSGGSYSGSPPPSAGPTSQPLDWQAYLQNWGFDSTITDELDRIFRSYSDPNQAAAASMAYIRGTQWYQTNFPGIQQGIANGTVGNEQDYRSYVNQVNQYYRSFYGRDVSGPEVANFLQSGYQPQFVQRMFQSQGYRAALQGNLSTVLTDAEMTTLANQEAGIDSPTGQKLLGLAQKFEELTPTYRQFGIPLDRSALENAYANNLSAAQIGNQFQAKGFRAAMPANMSNLFTQDELQSIANTQAGVPDANGQRLLNLASKYEELAPVYSQYGQSLDRGTVENAFNNNISADRRAREFQGQAYVAANGKDIQQTLGSFGEGGQASPSELTTLGQQNAGLDSILGEQLQARLDKARQRLAGAFQGTLASPAMRALNNGRIATSAGGGINQNDVAA